MSRKQPETPEVPSPLTWTPAFRRWLIQRYFDKYFKNVWKDPKLAWMHFLASTMRDESVRMPNGRVQKLPRAATNAECYAAALALFEADSATPTKE